MSKSPLKITVSPKYERTRHFRHLVAALRFAEDARHRQGNKVGSVEVEIDYGYRPHALGFYRRAGDINSTHFSWQWEDKA